MSTTPDTETVQPPLPDNYDFSEQVGHLLRRAYQSHAAIFQKAMPDPQLTAGQLAVLCVVYQSKACSLSHIVKRTSIDQATVRGVINRLKARSLIAVGHDEQDRRKVLVSLTPEGQRVLTEAVPHAIAISTETLKDFNQAEQMALLYLLKKLAGDEVPA